jgi:hypothetical protein
MNLRGITYPYFIYNFQAKALSYSKESFAKPPTHNSWGTAYPPPPRQTASASAVAERRIAPLQKSLICLSYKLLQKKYLTVFCFYLYISLFSYKAFSQETNAITPEEINITPAQTIDVSNRGKFYFDFSASIPVSIKSYAFYKTFVGLTDWKSSFAYSLTNKSRIVLINRRQSFDSGRDAASITPNFTVKYNNNLTGLAYQYKIIAKEFYSLEINGAVLYGISTYKNIRLENGEKLKNIYFSHLSFEMGAAFYYAVLDNADVYLNANFNVNNFTFDPTIPKTNLPSFVSYTTSDFDSKYVSSASFGLGLRWFLNKKH